MTTALLLPEVTEPPAATEPAETRGAGRDDVRLLVAGADGLTDTRFGELPSHLRDGDVVVVNVSATVPASLPAGADLRLHVSSALPGGFHAVEVRIAEGAASRPIAAEPPRSLGLPGGGHAELLARYPSGTGTRLWLARLELTGTIEQYLAEYGTPIRYPYVTRPWPIEAYQTIFGTIPGSAEMPSAARPFTHEAVTRLVTSGVAIAPIVLHTGVSSLESGEPPYPEWYSVPDTTAQRITAARRRGGRIVAVGTTVVRALETATGGEGVTHPGSGWTEMVVGPATGSRAVDGLLTGWHAPESTHLDMLHAVGGPELVTASYRTALAGGYLWHEFGDLHLLWRPRPRALSAV